MATKTGSVIDFEHAFFCLPRPGEVSQRIEVYSQPVYDAKGANVGSASVVRCQECGYRTVDGRLVRD